MKTSVLVAVALFALFVVLSRAEIPSNEEELAKAFSVEDHRVEVTMGELDNILEGEWLVEFYAPWCGHCKKLAPTWKILAAEMAAEMPSVKVAMVDAQEEAALATLFNVRGFPTIFFIQNGTYYKYESSKRTAEDFKNFAAEGYQSLTGNTISMSIRGLSGGDFLETVREGPLLIEFYYGNVKGGWESEHKAELFALPGNVFTYNCATDSAYWICSNLFGLSSSSLRSETKIFMIEDGWIYRWDPAWDATLADFVEKRKSPYRTKLPDLPGRITQLSDEYMVELTPANIEAELSSGPWVFLFYSDTCQWSKKFMPVLKELSELKAKEPQQYGFLSCTTYPDFCKEMGIKTFPTTWLVKEGKYMLFQGSRTVEFLAKIVPNFIDFDQSTKMSPLPDFGSVDEPEPLDNEPLEDELLEDEPEPLEDEPEPLEAESDCLDADVDLII